MTAEDVARRIFDQAGIDQIGPEGVGHVVEALLGYNSLDFADQDELATVSAVPPRLLVRLGLSECSMTMAVSLGLAMWWLAEHPDDAAAMSPETLALCLAVPPIALVDAVERLDHDVMAIAYEFVVPPEVVRLRLRALPSVHGSGFREKTTVLAG